MGKCKQCGKKCEGDYCFSHKPRKKLTTFKGTGPKALEQFDNAMLMHVFFHEIWLKRTHRSEVSGKVLGKEPSSAYFHHILPKSKYPELAYIEENVILLTLDEHANVESDMYKYDYINKEREKLTDKYINKNE